MPIETATFGAGCFWGVETAFGKLAGVLTTSVGYMGGHFEQPLHLDVCARITGHAEVVQIEYEAAIAPYALLLTTFWDIHDPTTLNRQGPDRGEQYRSVIFYHTPEQAQVARRSRSELQRSGRYANAIVTQIAPAAAYWRAAEEHQRYFEKKAHRLASSEPLRQA